MSSTIPASARFRRPEGLFFELSLCRPAAPVRVGTRRQEGEHWQMLAPGAVELLARLNRWQTAEEVGVSHRLLAELVEADLLFWSRGTPSEDLVNRPVTPLSGALRLARNVSAVPLLSTPDGRLAPFPFMARRGALDQAVPVGVLFTVQEMDTTVMTARIACCPRHAALLGEVIPRLDGRTDAETLGQRPAVRELLRMLNGLGLLERASPGVGLGGQVTWLGHAGIAYVAGGQRILVDPLLHPISVPSRHVDTPVHFSELGEVTAVLITHGDNDHLNPQSLYTLPRSVPIVIPRAATPEPYHVDMRRVLSLLGFSRVREVAEWERLTFGEVTVVAAPFQGEDWGLRLAARTYLLSSPELTIYASADSTTNPAAFARLAAEFRIDLAFLGVSGAAETYSMPPGYGYGDFYAPWIPHERRNEWVQLCNGPKEAAEAATLLDARFAFGYASGGASYFNLGYVDRGTHAALASHLNARSGGPRPLALTIGVPVEPRRAAMGDR